MNPKYKRILLKVSGEALSGGKGTGLDTDTLASIAAVVKQCREAGVEIAIVVGGGNFWRGHEQNPGRSHGHACHSDELFGAAKRA